MTGNNDLKYVFPHPGVLPFPVLENAGMIRIMGARAFMVTDRYAAWLAYQQLSAI